MTIKTLVLECLSTVELKPKNNHKRIIVRSKSEARFTW